MTESKTELIEDMLANTGFGFRVRWSYLPHWADVEAFEYIGNDVNEDGTDGPKFFNRKDSSYSPDAVYVMEEAEPYLTGYIKWDGCSELNIGCPHWCGPDDYRKHFRLLEALYRRAQELMKSGNWEPWDKVK